MTPEAKIKKRGREICAELGIYHFPVQQQGTSRSGIPDDILCLDGKFVSIEYKAHMDWGSRTKTALRTLPSPKQIIEMERIRESGGLTLVVDDTNIDYLAEDLDGDWKFTGSRLAWRWTYMDWLAYSQGKGHLVYPIGITIPEFEEG